jgi:hypothetical protein
MLRKSESLRLQNRHRNRFQRWRVDSLTPTAPVDLEIVNENWVVVASEILTETTSIGNAWIRSLHPLLTHKRLMKTESVPTQKSSPKHLSKVTRGFESARSPCWLRKSQRNNFQRWRVESSACPTLVDLETVNENWATTDTEIVTETDSKGDV